MRDMSMIEITTQERYLTHEKEESTLIMSNQRINNFILQVREYNLQGVYIIKKV